MKPGRVVVLKADPEEGWEAEYAVVLEVEEGGEILVQVEPCEDGDSGLREVTREQIEDGT